MTENEAIIFIRNANELSKKAIRDLEQIKDKAERIGIIGEYYANLENCYKEIESCEIATKALEEIQQYRSIGTVSECREAVEKQRAKKPVLSAPCKSINYYLCPQCRYVLYINKSFCCNCGSLIDWSEESV